MIFYCANIAYVSRIFLIAIAFKYVILDQIIFAFICYLKYCEKLE